MRHYFYIVLLCGMLVPPLSCRPKEPPPLFELMTATGIDFNNHVQDSEANNIFKFRNFYNGGGVAVGDLNNDGLPDVFFTANQGPNKLYLNKGNFQFEDISQKAGFTDKQQWSTGVVMVDINNDGWLDIYVCNSSHINDGVSRANQLFINNHDLTFTESAHAYGLDDTGYTTQVAFFDYDLDGDLDCFIINNSPIPVNTLNYANQRNLPAAQWPVADYLRGGGDHLLRNDNGKFVDVTAQAGIHGSLISFGLGVTVSDVNGDGYPDVYVSNDFFERDYLYINQKDGTFRDEIENRMEHTSLASMGADVADINNDGFPDIFTTDMLPGDDYRLKTTSSFDGYDVERLKQKSGFYRQYMQNTLQLNNRNGKFFDIARFSGVAASDWSWGALMFDADNDGNTDLYVCNGIYRDVTDQDFIDFFANDIVQKMALSGKKEELDSIIVKMPSHPLVNKLFRNQGNLRFQDIGSQWGITQPSFSNGATYADLDGDGDLDLVINNVNGPAFIYRNNSREQNGNHYIGFRLRCPGPNGFAIGAKVKLFRGGEILSREVMPSRGFQSSTDYTLEMGLGKNPRVDSVLIQWPDRKLQLLKNPPADTIRLIREDSQALAPLPPQPPAKGLLQELKGNFDRHTEDDFVDFYYEQSLPERLSHQGPRAVTGDVNGDGREDIYIGGAAGQPGQLYLGTAAGYVKKPEAVFEKYQAMEQVALALFDADGDGDLDLYIGPGGNHLPPRSPLMRHLLYRNDGRGNFTADTTAFPDNNANIGVAIAYDFDHDGDLDLFIGGRSSSYYYGQSPRSYLMVNDGKGHFTDQTAALCPALANIGMVTGAVWANITGDADKELVITGEWMGTRAFSFSQGHFTEIPTNLAPLSGWWQTLAAADLDGNGYDDLVIGNIGENFYLQPTRAEPVKLWINDFDQNNTAEKILTRTLAGRDMPVFLKRDITDQVPGLKKKNLRYQEYAQKSIQDLFPAEMIQSALVKQFDYPSSLIAFSDGKGNFALQRLPDQVQLSSVNAVCITDLNADGLPDLVLGGNLEDFLPQFGRLDASEGHVLLNLGKGRFQWLGSPESGLSVRGIVKDIRLLKGPGGPAFLFLRNGDYPALYQVSRP